MSQHHNKKRKKKSSHSSNTKLQLLAVVGLLILAAGTYSGAKQGALISEHMTYVPPGETMRESIGSPITSASSTISNIPDLSTIPTSTTKSESPTLISPSPKPTKTPVAIIPHNNLEEIRHGDTSKKQVIFTFDAGAGHRSAEGILAALAKHHVKGTFFFTGKWVEENPELAKRIVDLGYEVYNHSYSHPYFTELTAAEITLQLEMMDDLLASTTGARTKPYFRPPYGDRNSMVLEAASNAGYQSIYWDVDSLDWRTGETTESVKNRVLSNIHDGALVLMHVGDTPTGDVLGEIFTTIEERGYKIVSLTEGL